MRRFPYGFLWGAATAAHQIEGNNINSNWWMHEHEEGTAILEPSGDAADSYHRYREDISLLAELGLNSYRFSIEWARIEPERGMVSRASIDHYRRMVDTCLEFGLEPIVTLMHFTVPRWFERDGFWRADDAADLFARYTEIALPVVESGVRFVCTINEPNIAAMIAGSENAQPSSAEIDKAEVESPENMVAFGLSWPDLWVADSLLECHQRSREVLSQLPDIRSGWAVATQAFQAADEPGAAEKRDEISAAYEDWYLSSVAGDDFIGVQAYTRNIVGPEGIRPPADDVEKTLTNWEFYPQALGIGVRSAWEHGKGTPIMVTENGIATQDDERRIDYLRGALEGLHGCIEEGIEVLAYQHWSALDNYEWASGYGPTFGLIEWDKQTFARTLKPSARWYGEVARNNGV